MTETTLERRLPYVDSLGIYADGLTRAEWIDRKRKALVDHPFYKTPSDPSARVWRYMDFAKFVSLLASQALYFARASLLGDTFEGSVSHATLIAESALFRRVTNQIIETIGEEHRGQWEGREAWQIREQRERREFERDWTFVSCWHVNEDESDAMWKLYGSNGKAIAVQTTFDRLSTFVESHWRPEDLDPTVGLVNYSSYENEIVQTGYVGGQFFFKRKSFAHEHELRIVTSQIPMAVQLNQLGELHLLEDRKRTPVAGIELAADLNALIENIYVAPDAPCWMSSLVARVASKYDFAAPVLGSRLNQNPIY